MKNKSDVTIKELADELGITKQAVRRYFDQLPTELVPTKKGGSYQINPKAQAFIKDRVNRVDSKLDSQIDTNKVDVDTKLDSHVDSKNDSELVKFQKEFIQDKNEQIESLKEQIKKLHTLLDQQQQLTLQSNKQIDKLQLQLESTSGENTEETKTEESLQDQEQQTDLIRQELEQKNIENEQLKKKIDELQQNPKKGFWQRLFNS
ncbi:HTH domain-containing protein [Vagococcus fluvialis]|uniref:HTH domain-containing protein n=1 Tax=Vagococcus fluvialis TaxID=2738 RepID=UPI003B5AEFCF